MNNKAMERKIKARECIDIKDAKRMGPYYVLEKFVDGKDYADSKTETWIWSIGRAEQAATFELGGVTHIIPAGTIIASPASDLYQNDHFECLFLR